MTKSALREDRRRSTGSLVSSKIATALMSGALLYMLYRAVDIRGVVHVLRSSQVGWVVISVSMVAPIVLGRAVRFRWLLPAGAVSSLWEATRLTLVASAFNLFLPAKAGDFTKSIIVARRGGTSGGVAGAAVVYERLADLVGMISCGVISYAIVTPSGYSLVRHITPLVHPVVWAALGSIAAVSAALLLSERLAVYLAAGVERIFAPGRFARVHKLVAGWPELVVHLRGSRLLIIAWSIGLWLVQLLQIWLFTVALRQEIPFAACASLSAIALLVAQIPITVGGIGTRDIALVVLLTQYMPPEAAAAVGVLTATRGIIPPLAALPLLRRYVTLMFQAPNASSTSAAA